MKYVAKYVYSYGPLPRVPRMTVKNVDSTV